MAPWALNKEYRLKYEYLECCKGSFLAHVTKSTNRKNRIRKKYRRQLQLARTIKKSAEDNRQSSESREPHMKPARIFF
jgi:hypothetical protein